MMFLNSILKMSSSFTSTSSDFSGYIRQRESDSQLDEDKYRKHLLMGGFKGVARGH
jgi:hypothetical protein